MSFYTVIGTELKNRVYIISALKELAKRGEITGFDVIEKKERIEVDRSGDVFVITKNKLGEYQVEGDSRFITAFANRLKQLYAYASIKENLPLDFEISREVESGGSINIVLKG